MGRAGRAAGAESEPTWSPMNTPCPNLGRWRRTPGFECSSRERPRARPDHLSATAHQPGDPRKRLNLWEPQFPGL